MAQSNVVDHKVYLLGNTADLQKDSEFTKQLKALFPTQMDFTVLLNGDLVDTSVSGEPTKDDLAKIRELLETVAAFPKGKVVIIPGDRDWADSGQEGWRSVKNLEKAIASMGFDHVTWAVSKGCPGPESIDIAENIVLVAVNTQWWNHPFDKPKPSDATCKIVTETDFKNELKEELDDANGKNLLVAGHFPLMSVGEYGCRAKSGF